MRFTSAFCTARNSLSAAHQPPPCNLGHSFERFFSRCAATIKVIVVGNGGVGKSSMIRRFCTGEYTDTYKKTIGVDFLEKEKYIDRCTIEYFKYLFRVRACGVHVCVDTRLRAGTSVDAHMCT
jgi:hypothetical protein